MSNTQAERVEALMPKALDRVSVRVRSWVEVSIPDRAYYDERKVRAVITSLVAKNEALRADAERYRWLRDNAHPLGGSLEVVLKPGTDTPPDHLYGSRIDAAIDAARNTTQQQGG